MKHRIAHSFGHAASSYDAHSAPQRHAATQLAALIAARKLPRDSRVLEIGCGTGHLTTHLAQQFDHLLATDIAAPMVAACQRKLPHLDYLVMAAEQPALNSGHRFDLICASLAAQWFRHLPTTLAQLATLLKPGGIIAIGTLGRESFCEWRAAHAALELRPGTLALPDAASLREAFPRGQLSIEHEIYLDHAESAQALPRQLRAIGAATPVAGHIPLSAGQMRCLLREIGPTPTITYQFYYALLTTAA